MRGVVEEKREGEGKREMEEKRERNREREVWKRKGKRVGEERDISRRGGK